MVRIVPSTCVTFLVYENTKSYLAKLYYEPHYEEMEEEAKAKAEAAALVPVTMVGQAAIAVPVDVGDRAREMATGAQTAITTVTKS